MKTTFYKYHGTGNDFILIDNRPQDFSKNDTKLIARMCDRHFGIGADGLILIEDDDDLDFTMVYYNADGKLGSFCGNGARCAVHFARFLGIIDKETHFKASDGLHYASIADGKVKMGMNNPSEIREKEGCFFLDTGSPHHVQLVNDLEKFDVVKEGARLRYGLYGAAGSNINFVKQHKPGEFHVRTYERGVEDETLSCGTGVTAVALAMHKGGETRDESVKILTRGGELMVHFKTDNGTYRHVILEGPVEQVFKGEYKWKS